MRATGRDGIARAIYATARERRVVVLRVFRKKTRKTPKEALRRARERGAGATAIPFSELRKEWRKNSGYLGEFEALEPEFRLAREIIEARAAAGLTQIAERMGTSQLAVARLESGSKPSFRTLERFAETVDKKVEIRLASASTQLPEAERRGRRKISE